MTDDDLPALTGPVEVVGAGLIGTSIALVCRRLGIEVVLRDTSAENLRTAHGLGAGRAATPDDRPQLVVVAVPPAAVGDAIVDALSRTGAVVTDVGSVKAAPLQDVAGRVGPDDLARYVGSHPMAGSERSGPLAASAALFDGRPWAVTPHPDARPDAVGLVEALVLECGAAPLVMDAGGARPGGRPDLAPAAPRRRARRRTAGGGPRRAPRPLGAGRPRRHPRRGERPGAVAADPGGQLRGRARPARRGPRATSTP